MDSYYTSDGNLYEKSKYFKNGEFIGENNTNHDSYYADLDFFFLLDSEIYDPHSGKKPIYDE